jgi:DNA polymerase III delta prime subunit
MDFIPWVEKYRPNNFNDIVLEDINKTIFNNIIESNYFPNLLFYGPPGTGKTTTIINLIDKYQEKYNQKRKGLKIHLNASDDRGIDIIRNQINNFVNTKILFGSGMKFVILDEVDYMTKNAQQALRYLIQQYQPNIRFCLICNYISRIEYALQNEFIRLRFCNLPSTDIHHFLNNIVQKEKINVSEKQLQSIQYTFKSDIRSMINFLQSNHHHSQSFCKMITNEFWDDIIIRISNDDKKDIYKYLDESCKKYNIDMSNLIKNFIDYLIKNKDMFLTEKFLSFFTFIIHNITIKTEYIVYFFLYKFRELNKL